MPYSLIIWTCPIAYFGRPLFKSWLKTWSFYIPTSLQWPLSFVPKVALWRDLNVFIHSFIYSFLCTAHLSFILIYLSLFKDLHWLCAFFIKFQCMRLTSHSFKGNLFTYMMGGISKKNLETLWSMILFLSLVYWNNTGKRTSINRIQTSTDQWNPVNLQTQN